jgi:hypothetical protein
MAGNDPWAAFNPQGGAPSGGTVVRNPRLPAQVQGDILGNAQTGASTVRTKVQTVGDNIDNATKSATQSAVVAKAKSDAAKAAADAIAAANAARGLSPEVMAQNAQRRAALPTIDAGLKEFRDIYNHSFKGGGGSSGRGRMAEYMPSKVFGMTTNTDNALLDNVGSRLGAMFKPLIAPGSKDADAAAEYERKVVPFLPQHGDSDPELESKYAALYALRNQMLGVNTAQRAAKAAPANNGPVIDFNHWKN